MATGTFRGTAHAVRVLSLSLSLLALPGSALGQTAPPPAPAADPMAEAKLHFTNGVELLQATPPSYQDAFRQFHLAYEKSGGSWKVLGNLGLCALKLERDGEALKFYEQYLAKGGAEIDPGERSAIERDLLLVRGNMSTVTVRSTKPNTKLMVTRKGSEVPAQTYVLAEGDNALGLRSGELSLVAVSGEARESWEVIVGATESVVHEFSFAEKTVVAPAPVAVVPGKQHAEPTQPSAGGPSGLQVAGIVTGGVGVLGIVGGIVTGVLAKNMENDAQAKCIDSVCLESTQADFQSASDMATAANVLFISGGVLAGAGLTLVLVGGKKSPETARTPALFAVRPQATTGFLGLSAHGSF